MVAPIGPPTAPPTTWPASESASVAMISCQVSSVGKATARDPPPPALVERPRPRRGRSCAWMKRSGATMMPQCLASAPSAQPEQDQRAGREPRPGGRQSITASPPRQAATARRSRASRRDRPASPSARRRRARATRRAPAPGNRSRAAQRAPGAVGRADPAARRLAISAGLRIGLTRRPALAAARIAQHEVVAGDVRKAAEVDGVGEALAAGRQRRSQPAVGTIASPAATQSPTATPNSPACPRRPCR